MELTEEQIERQDFVDNAIFDLLQELNPSEKELEWDIEFIGDIRDVIQNYFVENKYCKEEVFYPYVEE